MEYASARETAAEWGVSERRVQRLCAEGRIPGARKVSGSWIVPADAEKPADPRKRADARSRADASEPQGTGSDVDVFRNASTDVPNEPLPPDALAAKPSHPPTASLSSEGVACGTTDG